MGERRRAISRGIVLGRTKLKTNACAPSNDPIIERVPTLAPGFHFFKVGYLVLVWHVLLIMFDNKEVLRSSNETSYFLKRAIK